MARLTSSLIALFAVGCSGSPTAPSAPTVTNPAATTPPVVSVPPVVPPVVTPPITATPDPVLSDPRYSASFYRMFALGAADGGFSGLTPLRRQTQAPRIYLRTVDDAGAAIDAYTLNETAAALINTTGKLTGVFGLAGLEQGTGTREGQAGWITVRWSTVVDDVCGRAVIGGGLITLFPLETRCRCSNGPAVRLYTVKHELGHVLGFYHTGDTNDLMSGIAVSTCDKDPSPREVFHASVAYSRAVGSLEPR